MKNIKTFNLLALITVALFSTNAAAAETAPFEVRVGVFNCQGVKDHVNPETGEVDYSAITSNWRQGIRIYSDELVIPAEGEWHRGCKRSYNRSGRRAETFLKTDELKIDYSIWRSGKSDIGNRIGLKIRFTPQSRTYGTDYNFPLEIELPRLPDGGSGMFYRTNLCEGDQDKGNKEIMVSVVPAGSHERQPEQSTDPYVFNNQPCDESIMDVTDEIRDAACQVRVENQRSSCDGSSEYTDPNSAYCKKSREELCATAYEVK